MLLNIKKVIILNKYWDFINIFLVNLIIELLKKIDIKYYFINIINNKQLFYNLIYSLKLIKINNLNTNIKINLANQIIIF